MGTVPRPFRRTNDHFPAICSTNPSGNRPHGLHNSETDFSKTAFPFQTSPNIFFISFCHFLAFGQGPILPDWNSTPQNRKGTRPLLAMAGHDQPLLAWSVRCSRPWLAMVRHCWSMSCLGQPWQAMSGHGHGWPWLRLTLVRNELALGPKLDPRSWSETEC